MVLWCNGAMEYLLPCSCARVLLLDEPKPGVDVQRLEQLLRVDVPPVQGVRRHHRVHVPDSGNGNCSNQEI